VSEDAIMPNGFTLSQVNSCTNRGKSKGFKSNGKGCSCNRKGRETLYKCSVYGSCTVQQYNKNQQEQVCVQCPSVVPGEVSNVKPL
jgi:hypothetical protein